ncbi:hypothetical protein GCM10027091_80700 [Streptomyces daliensis]
MHGAVLEEGQDRGPHVAAPRPSAPSPVAAATAAEGRAVTEGRPEGAEGGTQPLAAAEATPSRAAEAPETAESTGPARATETTGSATPTAASAPMGVLMSFCTHRRHSFSLVVDLSRCLNDISEEFA